MQLERNGAPCGRTASWARHRRGAPRVGEVNFRRIEVKRAIQHDIQAAASWQLEFGSPRHHDGGQARGGSYTRADSRAFGASGNRADARSGAAGLNHSAGIGTPISVGIYLAFLAGIFT